MGKDIYELVQKMVEESLAHSGGYRAIFVERTEIDERHYKNQPDDQYIQFNIDGDSEYSVEVTYPERERGEVDIDWGNYVPYDCWEDIEDDIKSYRYYLREEEGPTADKMTLRKMNK